MSKYKFSITALYSNITDHELDAVVAHIKQEFPNCGCQLMQGHLLSCGLRVHCSRLRDAMYRVNLDGVTINFASAIVRGKYDIYSPLSLWYLDGIS